MDEKLRQDSLDYHRSPKPGKIAIAATKALTNQNELAMAYSPGVAAASEAIAADPAEAANLTSRSNLVAVISNGTAVLGLGAIGPLASKPVMEGKGVLFKKFADIDVFDIEIDENDPEKLIDIVASLEPTFGGINLEDIKAPECFQIENELKKRMKIPVFHDDQHGTAVITAAAVINALEITGRKIEDMRLTASGAGAAGMACLDLLVSLGLPVENVIVCDRGGVVHADRDDLDDRKAVYAHKTDLRRIDEAIVGAHIFLGVSGPNVLTAEMVKTMNAQPIILALANPTPEIMPDVARNAVPDALIATGRSDFPNQVNNVLCFPYIFRGAIDVGASEINEAMKLACAHALAELARLEASDVSAAAYGGKVPQFGPDYLIPQPFDPRLLAHLAPAVAQAAMDSGVAARPIENMTEYRDKLNQFVFRTGLMMKPVFEAARRNPKRVIFAEGENEVILRAVQTIKDDGLAKPILVGRPEVIQMRIERMGLRLDLEHDIELINPESDPRYKAYWQTYHQLQERNGVSPEIAKHIVRTNETVIAALAVKRGDADAMLAGPVNRFQSRLKAALDVLGMHQNVETIGAMSILASDSGNYFVCDTHVNEDPTAEQIADLTEMASKTVRLFGIQPKVALLSHSSFGSHNDNSCIKMQNALQLLRERCPNLEVEGEMSADMAILEGIRQQQFPNSRLTGSANLLVMPNIDAAHIAFNFARVATKGTSVGPVLMGTGMPMHVLTSSATVRRVVNMAAIACVDAQIHERNLQTKPYKNHQIPDNPEDWL